MTRINWDEVHQLTRLDEIIAYSIITLQEAYTDNDNDDASGTTKAEIKDWVRWEIAYDENGRAFFRYGASLYVVDRTPMGDRDFLELINAPTKWLVNHPSISIDPRVGDTSLLINTLVDLPTQVTSMEKLLFWAIVLGDWWNATLKYIAATQAPIIPTLTPLDNWGNVPVSPGFIILVEDNGGTIDSQFDAFNGTIDDPAIPDFLKNILDRPANGTGDFNQTITLPTSDSGAYRENLSTCEEQDPAIVNYSQEQLRTLLPAK
jgi:hypothetical protein